MERKTTSELVLGAILLIVFILFTWSLTWHNIQPIGPYESNVAYANINKAVYNLLGSNSLSYKISSFSVVVSISIAVGFACLGVVQWVKRKSIFSVDNSILVLGVFYCIVFSAFLFFEFNVINFQPTLIDGSLKSSYPSSTTMLSTFLFPTAMMQFKRLIKDMKTRRRVNYACGLSAVLIVIFRLLSGAHWFTDILGGLIFSISMVLFYHAACNICQKYCHQNNAMSVKN